MNMKRVALFYDIVSFHSWILFERLSLVEPHCSSSVRFEYHPVHAADIITKAGGRLPFYQPALKKHFYEDIRFLGQIHGIPVRTPHTPPPPPQMTWNERKILRLDRDEYFDDTIAADANGNGEAKEETELLPTSIDDLLAAAASSTITPLWLNWVAEERPDLLKKCSRALWKRLWVENRSVHTEDDLIEVFESTLGFAHSEVKTIVDSLNSDDTKWAEILEWRQSKASASGCFGIPWTIVSLAESDKMEDMDGQQKMCQQNTNTTFYGCDRWPLLRNEITFDGTGTSNSANNDYHSLSNKMFIPFQCLN